MSIQELRKRAGYTQKELAKRLNIAPNTLSQYETGKNRLDVNVAKQLAEIFGVSLDEIYGYNTPAAKSPAVNDEDIKFALFGDAPVTDEDYEDVKRYAEFVARKKAGTK